MNKARRIAAPIAPAFPTSWTLALILISISMLKAFSLSAAGAPRLRAVALSLQYILITLMMVRLERPTDPVQTTSYIASAHRKTLPHP